MKRWLCTLLVGGMVIAGLWPQALSAHSGGTPVLTNEPAGPYHLFAWMQPDPLRVGDVHLSLALVLAPAPNAPANSLVEPVTDAAVTATFSPVDQPEAAIQATATAQNTLNGFYYEIDTELPQTGLWQISIQAVGASGTGNVTFQREVFPPRQVNWVLIGGGGFVLVVLIGLMGVWNRLQAQE